MSCSNNTCSCSSNSSTSVNPGEGYRLLKIGETILASDEFLDLWDKNLWLPATQYRTGKPFEPGLRPYRRKVEAEIPRCLQADPGKGYRLLQPFETIQKGDEYYMFGFWHPYEICFGEVNGPTNSPSRRKVEAPKAEPKKAKAVNAGYGFRLLKDGELFLAGDEYYGLGEVWTNIPMISVGQAMSKLYAPTRRTVTIPAGYRLIGETELTIEGDRYLEADGSSLETVRSNAGKVWATFPSRNAAWVGVIRKVEAPKADLTKPVKPGHGYRLLKIGEALLATDEFLPPYSGAEWTARTINGGKLDSLHYPHRRKVAVPAGYRLLAETEIARSGDHYLETNGLLGTPVCSNIGQTWASLVKTGSISAVMNVGIIRKVLPKVEPRKFAGEGWRFLKKGERFQKGDEVVSPEGYSFAISTTCYGDAVPDATSVLYPEGYYRRKVGTPTETPKAVMAKSDDITVTVTMTRKQAEQVHQLCEQVGGDNQSARGVFEEMRAQLKKQNVSRSGHSFLEFFGDRGFDSGAVYFK